MLQRIAARLPLLLAAVPVAVGIYVALQPASWQVSHVLSDDAYYYFQIARNAASGAGVSLDGINLTNGFHPLWMAVLVTMGRVLPDAGVIPAALLLGAACGAATILLLQRLLVRWGVSAGWRAACLCLVALNPWLLAQWVNGLETAAACLLLVATWLYADSLFRSGTLRLRRAVALSALASLAALARTDAAVALAPLLVYAWWKLLRTSGGGVTTAARYGLSMAGAVVAVQLPWLVWNWASFGTIEQSSGAAFSFVNHQLLYNVHADDLVTNVKGAALGMWNSAKLALQGFAAPMAYVLALGAAVLWRSKQRMSFRSAGWEVAAAAAAGLGILFTVHGALRWAYRPWYAAPLVIGAALAVGYCSRQLPRLPLPRWLLGALAALCLASFAAATPRVLAEYAPQAKMYEVAGWIGAHVGEDEVVGAFNSGIYAYFSGRKVVNLDGLVNNAAAAALRERSLRAYAASVGVDYVIDYDMSVGYRYGWAWDAGRSAIADMPVVQTFPAGGRGGSVRVYRLD